MQPIRTFLSSPITLTSQWRVWGLMLVAFARQVLAMERAQTREGSRGASEKARQLERTAFAALFTINEEIASLEESHPAAERLQVIAVSLALLAMFAQRMRARLTLPESAFGRLALLFRLPSAPARAAGFIDTS